MAPSIPPLLWASALLLLSRSAAAVDAVPCLLLLRGPLALVLVALGVGAALARAGQREPAPLVDPGPKALFLAAAVFFVVSGLWYTSRLRVTGDEPHYLVMARSLWREGDLDLRDNYDREDWRQDTPGPVRPHYGAPRRDGRPFPAHSPGLPLLLAPVDALLGRAGCVVLLSLLAAWLTVEVRALALRFVPPVSADPPGGPDSSPGALAWAAAVGPPVAAYAFHVYTEVPSALAVALALRLLIPGANAAAAVGAAVAASALPWLHVKMIPAAAVLGIVGVLRLRGRARLAFLLVASLMAVAYASYYFLIFGSVTPLAIYGGVPWDASGSALLAAAGLLIDRSFGLLPHAPIFVLALAGFVPLLRERRNEAWPLLLVAAAVALPILPWRMWWGGQCPPARFLVPLVPFLAVAVDSRVRGPVRGLMRWRAALLAAGLALFALAVVDPGRLLLVNRANLAPRLWTALAGEASPDRYLPSLTRPDAFEIRVAVLWGMALALLLALDAAARRTPRVDRLFRGLGLPIALFLGIGLGVDHWARAGATVPSAEPVEREARFGAGAR